MRIIYGLMKWGMILNPLIWAFLGRNTYSFVSNLFGDIERGELR